MRQIARSATGAVLAAGIAVSGMAATAGTAAAKINEGTYNYMVTGAIGGGIPGTVRVTGNSLTITQFGLSETHRLIQTPTGGYWEIFPYRYEAKYAGNGKYVGTGSFSFLPDLKLPGSFTLTPR